jgi:hypothetical protein
MDPRHDPRVKKAKREAAVADRIAQNHDQAAQKYGSVLEREAGAAVALTLMDEPVVEDEFMIQVKQHIDHGFPLPKDIEARFRSRVENGVLVDENEDIVAVVADLLTVALTGLKNGEKKFAWNLVEYWGQNRTWSGDQFACAKNLLSTARNGRR